MNKKPSKHTAAALKKYLREMRDCLNQSVPGFDDKSIYSIRFSRIGKNYKIEGAPVPPTDRIGEKLEQSFNKFMSNLEVKYDNKVEGLATIGTQLDTFVIGYNNYKNNGDEIVSNTHCIEGVI